MGKKSKTEYLDSSASSFIQNYRTPKHCFQASADAAEMLPPSSFSAAKQNIHRRLESTGVQKTEKIRITYLLFSADMMKKDRIGRGEKQRLELKSSSNLQAVWMYGLLLQQILTCRFASAPHQYLWFAIYEVAFLPLKFLFSDAGRRVDVISGCQSTENVTKVNNMRNSSGEQLNFFFRPACTKIGQKIPELNGFFFFFWIRVFISSSWTQDRRMIHSPIPHRFSF